MLVISKAYILSSISNKISQENQQTESQYNNVLSDKQLQIKWTPPPYTMKHIWYLPACCTLVRDKREGLFCLMFIMNAFILFSYSIVYSQYSMILKVLFHIYILQDQMLHNLWVTVEILLILRLPIVQSRWSLLKDDQHIT